MKRIGMVLAIGTGCLGRRGPLRREFAPLHQGWQAASPPHAGIIVSQQLGSRQYGLLLQRMLCFLNQITAEEMRNTFVHLEQFK